MNSRHHIAVLCFAFIASHGNTLAMAAGAPIISAVTASATSPGTAVVSWTTDIPSTSQVVVVDGTYAPVSASQQDTKLVTTHTVQMALIPGTTDIYYVVSGVHGAIASSANSNSPTVISLPAVSATAPEDYRLDIRGANTVYEGYDLYLGLTGVLLGGQTAHLTFDAPDGLPAGATFHVVCAYNTNILNEQADSYWDSQGRQWCWNGTSNPSMVRVRTSPTTPLGQYSLTIHTEAGGIKRDAVADFTVLGVPQPPVRQATLAPPPIPELATWQQKLTSLGQAWCNPGGSMSFGAEQQIWYYDGGRTYFQAADYTNSSGQWTPCAVNIVTQYRDYVLWNNGGIPAWRVFPHGLAMNYWRTGDTGSRDAVMALAGNSPYAVSSGGVDITLIRETAYLIEALTLAQRLGAAYDPRLDRAVAFGLGQFNQLFSSGNSQFDQPFFDGLMAEALIEYYEFSKDPRIPDAIGQMLDWLWTYGWKDATQQMAYNTLAVPASYSADLNNLVAPAYAWYWALTGEQIYQQRGDELFAAAIAGDISYSGKIFNQNFRWTFDYVNWRTMGSATPSVFLSGSPATPPPTPSQQPDIRDLFVLTAYSKGVSSIVVYLTSAAQVGGMSVALSSSNSAAFSLPASVVIPAGLVEYTVPVTVGTVSTATNITVQGKVISTITRMTQVLPAPPIDVASLSMAATMTSGTTGSLTVLLTAAAPAGGTIVGLSSSNPALL